MKLRRPPHEAPFRRSTRNWSECASLAGSKTGLPTHPRSAFATMTRQVRSRTPFRNDARSTPSRATQTPSLSTDPSVEPLGSGLLLGSSGQAQGDLNPILAVELANHSTNQILHALFLKSHRFGDLLVGEAFGDQASNFVFPIRQLEPMGHHSRSSTSAGDRSNQIGAKGLSLVEECLRGFR